MISERRQAVLRAVVEEYVAEAEPVASKTVADKYALGVSAATIRSDMVFLEQEGLILSPYTSSGRLPTDKGYRTFVDQLLKRVPKVTSRLRLKALLENSRDVDDLLEKSARILASLTNQVAVLQAPDQNLARIKQVELIHLSETWLLLLVVLENARALQRVIEFLQPYPEEIIEVLPPFMTSKLSGLACGQAAGWNPPDQFLYSETGRIFSELKRLLQKNRQRKVIMAGQANLATSAEDFGGRVVDIMLSLEDQWLMLKILDMLGGDGWVQASIGGENEPWGLEGASVLISEYSIRGSRPSKVGLVGPTRMRYERNIHIVSQLARELSDLLGA